MDTAKIKTAFGLIAFLLLGHYAFGGGFLSGSSSHYSGDDPGFEVAYNIAGVLVFVLAMVYRAWPNQLCGIIVYVLSVPLLLMGLFFAYMLYLFYQTHDVEPIYLLSLLSPIGAGIGLLLVLRKRTERKPA